MSRLRSTQIETLRLVAKRERQFGQDMTPTRLAATLSRSEKSARARLDRLCDARYLYALLALTDDGRYYRSGYRLSDKGRSALAREHLR